MLQFLLDTDHLTLLEHGHALVVQRLAAQPLGIVGLPIVTIEEYLRGRLTAVAQAKDGRARILRYGYLADSLQLIEQFEIAPFDQAAEDQFQIVRGLLRLHIGTQDQKIGVIALAMSATLVTRNKRDFGQITGLNLEDWSV